MPSQKIGYRHSADGEDGGDVVHGPAAIDRRGDACGNAYEQGREPGDDAELEGHEGPGAEFLCDGALVLGRAAEVALHGLAEPDAVLDEDGFVEVVLLADQGDLLFVQHFARADQGPHGIAGDRQHEGVDEEGDQGEHGHHLEQAADYVLPHGAICPQPSIQISRRFIFASQPIRRSRFRTRRGAAA